MSVAQLWNALKGCDAALPPLRFLQSQSTRKPLTGRAEQTPVADGARGSSTSRMPGPPRSHPRSFDPLALAIALAIAVLGFLPVANWLTGGHHAPWYAPVASTWVTEIGRASCRESGRRSRRRG